MYPADTSLLTYVPLVCFLLHHVPCLTLSAYFCTTDLLPACCLSAYNSTAGFFLSHHTLSAASLPTYVRLTSFCLLLYSACCLSACISTIGLHLLSQCSLPAASLLAVIPFTCFIYQPESYLSLPACLNLFTASPCTLLLPTSLLYVPPSFFFFYPLHPACFPAFLR